MNRLFVSEALLFFLTVTGVNAQTKTQSSKTMTNPQTNQDRLNYWFSALLSGDQNRIPEAFQKTRTADYKMTTPGNSQVAGVKIGMPGFFEAMTVAGTLTQGTLGIQPVALVANETEGVAVLRLTGQRDGKSLNMIITEKHQYNRDGLIYQTELIPADQAVYDDFFRK